MGASKSNPVEAEEIARFAGSHRERGVVSFGLAGSEVSSHDPFKKAAEITLASGLLFVPHAGERRGSESVTQVLDLGASRIAHGIRAIEDKDVVGSLVEGKIACDVALSSNVRLGVVRDLKDHPFLRLLRSGVPITLGTDDSLFFGSSLLEEYALARSLGATDEELAAIAANSIRYSGMPKEQKTEHITKVNEWLSNSSPS
jgi:adenosine deaminase